MIVATGQAAVSHWLASIGLADGASPNWRILLKADPEAWGIVAAAISESPMSLKAFERIRKYAPEELASAARSCSESLDRLNSMYRSGAGKSGEWLAARARYEQCVIGFRSAADRYRDEVLPDIRAWRSGTPQPQPRAPSVRRHQACTDIAAERIQKLARHLRASAASSVRTQPAMMAEALGNRGLRRAFHITNIENIASICSLGILPHSLAPQSRADISNGEIQNRRASVRIDAGFTSINLHDFVPMFYAAKTPMLWKCADPVQGVGVEKLCTIEFSIGAVADWCEVLAVTNRNAATNGMVASANPEQAVIVPRDVVLRSTWHDIPDGSALRAAELLCYPLLPAPAIAAIHVASDDIVSRVAARLKGSRMAERVKCSPEQFPQRV